MNRIFFIIAKMSKEKLSDYKDNNFLFWEEEIIFEL